MKVLISGFTTFGSHSENSSQIIADRIKTAQIPGIEIQTCILPVAFSSAFEHLKIEIESFKPDVVICLGLAGNRKHIDLEKVAVNLIHCEIPDNEGVHQEDMAINKHGPAAYFTTLPIKEMREVKTEFPVNMSLSAGSYVCNYLMYKTLEYTEGKGMKAGFIHLPNLGQDGDKIFNSLIEMLRVL